MKSWIMQNWWVNSFWKRWTSALCLPELQRDGCLMLINEWASGLKGQTAALCATWPGECLGSAVPIFMTFALCFSLSVWHLPAWWPTDRWSVWWNSSTVGPGSWRRHLQTAPGGSWCPGSNSWHRGFLHVHGWNSIRSALSYKLKPMFWFHKNKCSWSMNDPRYRDSSAPEHYFILLVAVHNAPVMVEMFPLWD